MDALLDHGASLTEQTYMDNTPLLLAAEKGKISMVDFLFNHGASFSEINIIKQNVIKAASQFKHKELVCYLEARQYAKLEYEQSSLLQRIFLSSYQYFLQTHYHHLSSDIQKKLNGGNYPLPQNELNLEGYQFASNDLVVLCRLLPVLAPSLTRLSLRDCQLTAE